MMLAALCLCGSGSLRAQTFTTLSKSVSGGSGTFTATGSMNFTRFGHHAVLLNRGDVLVVSGHGDNSAELYNPATGNWTLTGSTSALHEFGTATLLSNGEVLLAGGGSGNYTSNPCTTLAELYNPATGQWTVTGSMTSVRCAHTATLLPNGQVLVAGGNDDNANSLATAELYSPATGTWGATGSLNTARTGPLAELLGSGTVLVAGGENVTGSVNGDCALSAGCKETVLASAEIFNPSQGGWEPTGSMPAAGGSGSLLANGDVLKFFNSFYTPATGTWTAAGAFPRFVAGDSTATLLGNGLVLATGFISTYSGSGYPPLLNAYLYNFSTNGYTRTGPMTTTRFEDTATLLPNGQVLVAGGRTRKGGVNTATASAELYTP
jgi:N-acetylneuraminic acid mutarotase